MGSSRCALGFLLLGPAFGVEQPFWGCGLLGNAPGINADGSTSASMQKFIDGLKVTNKYNGKLAYWNWNYAPEDVSDPSTGKPTGHQYLTKDFLFMPENWGVGVAEAKYIREANVVGFADSSGVQCPAQMADIFLGANEPDIYGSCMGDMMGACTAPCTAGEVNAHNCPVASLDTSIKHRQIRQATVTVGLTVMPQVLAFGQWMASLLHINHCRLALSTRIACPPSWVRGEKPQRMR